MCTLTYKCSLYRFEVQADIDEKFVRIFRTILNFTLYRRHFSFIQRKHTEKTYDDLSIITHINIHIHIHIYIHTYTYNIYRMRAVHADEWYKLDHVDLSTRRPV